MVALLAGLTAHPVVAGASALALLGGGYAATAAVIAEPPPAVVQSVVDGDTIRVTRGGDEFKVRLLNIDTPESVDPDKPVGCLAPEATAFLRQRLPAGTLVQLDYDQERQDRYGRDLAGVFVDGSLVNAEIARAGLGAAVLVGDNDRFYQQVLTAQEQAEADRVGLHSPEIDCTLPAQVLAYENRTAALEQAPSPGSDLAAIDARGEELEALIDDGAALDETMIRRDLFPMVAFTEVTRTALRDRLQTAVDSVEDLKRGNDQARADEVERQRIAAEEAARRAAEEEAARRAAEEAARRQAEDVARAAAAAAQPRTDNSADDDSDYSGDDSSSQSSGGGEPWNSPGPDLDCADIGHKVYITGPDYHRLDRDGDGVGCESYG
jgi:micrococcal nuclease